MPSGRGPTSSRRSASTEPKRNRRVGGSGPAGRRLLDASAQSSRFASTTRRRHGVPPVADPRVRGSRGDLRRDAAERVVQEDHGGAGDRGQRARVRPLRAGRGDLHLAVLHRRPAGVARPDRRRRPATRTWWRVRPRNCAPAAANGRCRPTPRVTTPVEHALRGGRRAATASACSLRHVQPAGTRSRIVSSAGQLIRTGRLDTPSPRDTYPRAGLSTQPARNRSP